jgi:KDO2-lipid IV(A) lauroyltransferase
MPQVVASPRSAEGKRRVGTRAGTTPAPPRPLVAVLARTAIRAVGLLPLPVAHAIGAAAGTLVALLPTRERRIARVNVDLAFPDWTDAQRARLVRRSLAHLGRMAAELGLLWTRPPDEALARVLRVEGGELLESARRDGRPVLVLSLHLGSWELLSLWLCRYGLVAPYRPPRVEELDAFVRASRERAGGRLVPPGAGGVRALMETLRAGGIAGQACDQDPGEGAAVFVPFLGVLASTRTLPARLASSTGAVAIVGWCERVAGRGFVIRFEPAPPELSREDATEGTRALNETLTRIVRTLPEQYLWSYKRFRLRPKGERDPYGR